MIRFPIGAFGIPRQRRAMTLIELMVSIALSALLMAALVGVLSGMAKQSKLSERYDRPVWPQRVVELIRRDLLSADSLWMRGDTVWFQTDSPSYQTDRQGVRPIGYQTNVLDDGQSVLERIDGERSVLAMGPTRILVERLDSTGMPQPLPPSAGPVPQQIRLWIWQGDSDRPMVFRDIVVR